MYIVYKCTDNVHTWYVHLCTSVQYIQYYTGTMYTMYIPGSSILSVYLCTMYTGIVLPGILVHNVHTR